MIASPVAAAKVLVVDDDPAIREIVATRLRSLGFDVSIAGNGTSALERVKQESFDVVLLDILMPDIDGHQVLEGLQEMGGTPSVIFLTALGGLDDRLRGLYEGAVDYIAKPFEPDELAARVTVAARLRREVDSARAEMYVDSLTGLDNRAGFDRWLARELARSVRFGRPCALVLLDVDDLKQTNDRHGHAAGDELLKAVARAIRKTCREIDYPARIGGDEFAIVLPETDTRHVEKLTQRLRDNIAAERFPSDGEATEPECSIGIATFPVEADGKNSLMRVADAALYKDKARRRPR